MELTTQVTNEFHPLLNEVWILHKHSSNCLVGQNVDEVANYWPITVIDKGRVLAVHYIMF